MQWWIICKFTKKEQHAHLNSLLILVGISNNASGRPKSNEDKLDTHIEAVNQILIPYATNTNSSKVASETSILVKLANEYAIQFIDAVCFRVVKCDNAFTNECSKKVFIDNLTFTSLSDVSMFWSCERMAYLSDFA